MNLTHLKYFIAVASLGSVTKAAEENYVSQSAVSKTIKQLENELGVQLFEREGRTIRLNQRGKLFYSYISDSLNLLNRGIHAVQEDENIQQKPINVLFTVASSLISEIIIRFKKAMPGLNLNIYQKNSFAKDLKQFDFIISTEKIPNFHSIPLITEEIKIGAKKGILPNKNFIDVSELKKYTLIGLDQDTELAQTVEQYLTSQKLKLNFKYRSDEPATVRQLIANGLGIGFIPAISWHNFDENEIDTIHLLPTSPQRTIFLNSPHTTLNNAQRLFSNEIANVFLDQREKTYPKE